MSPGEETDANLRTIYEQVQARRHQRRDLEWRNAVAIWTALVVLIGLVAQKDQVWTEHLGGYRWLVAGLVAAVGGFHIWYVFAISNNQAEDLQRCKTIETAMGAEDLGEMFGLQGKDRGKEPRASWLRRVGRFLFQRGRVGRYLFERNRHAAVWVQIVFTCALVVTLIASLLTA